MKFSPQGPSIYPEFLRISRPKFALLGRAEANGGGWGAEHPPADHLSENFAFLSEFLCSR